MSQGHAGGCHGAGVSSRELQSSGLGLSKGDTACVRKTGVGLQRGVDPEPSYPSPASCRLGQKRKLQLRRFQMLACGGLQKGSSSMSRQRNTPLALPTPTQLFMALSLTRTARPEGKPPTGKRPEEIKN